MSILMFKIQMANRVTLDQCLDDLVALSAAQFVELAFDIHSHSPVVGISVVT